MTWNDNYLHHHSVHRDVINSGALLSTYVYEPFMLYLSLKCQSWIKLQQSLVTIKITFKTGLVCFRSGKFLWGVAGTLSRRSSRWWSWSRSWPSGRSSEGSASKTSGPEKRAILVLGVLFFLHCNSLVVQFSIGLRFFHQRQRER